MEQINLYRMRMLERKTRKLAWRIERERARAERSSCVLTGMPGREYRSSRVEDGAIRISELKDVYRETFEELDGMREALEPVISSLDDPTERGVMRLRYLKGYKAEEIAEAVYLTDRMVYYILRRSERKLAERYPELIRAE